MILEQLHWPAIREIKTYFWPYKHPEFVDYTVAIFRIKLKPGLELLNLYGVDRSVKY